MSNFENFNTNPKDKKGENVPYQESKVEELRDAIEEGHGYHEKEFDALKEKYNSYQEPVDEKIPDAVAMGHDSPDVVIFGADHKFDDDKNRSSIPNILKVSEEIPATESGVEEVRADVAENHENPETLDALKDRSPTQRRIEASAEAVAAALEEEYANAADDYWLRCDIIEKAKRLNKRKLLNHAAKNDSHEFVRMAAIRGSGKLLDFDVLADVAKNDESEGVRAEAVREIEKNLDPDIAERLANDSSPLFRLIAVKNTYNLLSPDTVERLAGDSDLAVRNYVLREKMRRSE